MTKFLPLMLLVALGATAVVGVTVIGASPSSERSGFKPWARNLTHDAVQSHAQASAGTGERIVVRTREAGFKVFDADRNGRDSVGDYFLFSERLFNASGDRVGRDWGTCTLHFGNAAQCHATLRLFGRGELVVAGTLSERENGSPFIAITGGTGEFADAGGELNTGIEGRLIANIVHMAK